MSGTQPLDAATSTGRFTLSVIRTVGQPEQEAMLERQREGIAKAKREGRSLTPRKESDPLKSPTGLGIGRASVYRVLTEQSAGERQA
jgi:DNA invertase Pin-like site-specific DNA recombinase